MGSSSAKNGSSSYDYSFKILLIGDTGVGKTTLLLSYTSDVSENPTPTDAHIDPTIGVDCKIKQITVGGKRLKLTIWDTAGLERFRSMTTPHYRGAHAIILVYDVTKRQTFQHLSDVWVKEIERQSVDQKCVKMIIGNKVDKESERAVTRDEGAALAQKYGYLFFECSAKTRLNVEQCFQQLAQKTLDVNKPKEAATQDVSKSENKTVTVSNPENKAATEKKEEAKQPTPHTAPPSTNGGCCTIQ